MDYKQIQSLIDELAHPRLSGTKEERNAEKRMAEVLNGLGLQTRMETFPVSMFRFYKETLTVDGEEIFCKAHGGCGCGSVEGELYHMPLAREFLYPKCKGKIVILDDELTEERYRKLAEHGALAIITRKGGLDLKSDFIRRGELRYAPKLDVKIPTVCIRAEDFWQMIKNGARTACITVEQETYEGRSYNLLAEIPGEREESIVFASHTDSVEGVSGAYDNLSGCLCQLLIAEYFLAHKPKYTIKFLFCGSEERGLLGSKAYCLRHRNKLKKAVLNITLDMVGTVGGAFGGWACANKESQTLLEEFEKEQELPMTVRYGLRSTDVKPFVHLGIPAVSFARYSPDGIAPIHTVHDMPESISPRMIALDAEIICKFTRQVMDAEVFPIPRTVDEKLKKQADDYMG